MEGKRLLKFAGDRVAAGESAKDGVVLASEAVILGNLIVPEVAGEAIGIEESLARFIADRNAPGVIGIAVFNRCSTVYDLTNAA